MDVLRLVQRELEPSEKGSFLVLLTTATYVALALLLIVIGIVPLTGSDDVWSHIAVGQWIVEHRAVPRHNLFTWHHQTHPWVAHSWLSQVIFYGLWRVGGTVAIVLLRLVAVTICFSILYSLWRKAKAPLTFFPAFVFLSLSAASLRFSTRPELFTLIALALQLKWLLEFKFCGSKAARFLPLLFIAWVNLHGAFVTGIVLLLLFALGETIQTYCARRSILKTDCALDGNRLRFLFTLTLLSLGATLCSPYGIKVYRALSPDWIAALQSHVVEWGSLLRLYQNNQLAWEAVVPAAALLCWAFYLALRSSKGVHLSLLLWLLSLSALAYSANRQMGVLAMACLAIAGAVQPPVSSAQRESMSSQKRNVTAEVYGFTAVMLCLILLTFTRVIADGKTSGRRYGFGIDVETIPVAAARFIRDNQLGQRLYNPPNYAYLDWYFGASHRLFYDIQADYPSTLLTEAVKAAHEDLDPMEYVERWNFDVVLCPLSLARAPLPRYLSRSSQWTLVYWDGNDAVFVRRLPQYARVIQKHEYHHANPFLAVDPVAVEKEKSVGEVERAVRLAPKTFALYRRAALLYSILGEPKRAEEMIQQAVTMRPYDPQARELKSIFGCPR